MRRRSASSALAFGITLLEDLLVCQESLAIGPDDGELVRPLTRLEANPQPRTDETCHRRNLFQGRADSLPAAEGPVERVVHVVFLDSIPFIELKLAFHLPGAIAW